MAIQTLSQIKAWFKKNCYPTEGQFADTWDSFWHKAESLPMSIITGLTDILNSKQDKATATVVDVSEIEVFDPDKVGGYLAGNTFVSYKNLASSDVAFHTASIYHCVTDAAIGESPETHPSKWENQGTTITYTSSSTCKTHVVLMSELATLTGMKNGDVVGVQQLSQYYKYSTVSGWTFFANFIWDLKQTTGNSTTAVMSQKATTDAIAAASGGGSGLASTWEPNITAIRELTSHNTGNDVGDYATLNIYEYDAALSNADDGDTYLKPDDVSGNGRWFKKKQLAPIRPATTKTVLVDTDETTGNDSANAFGQIKATWGDVKVFLKTYFDTLYAPKSGYWTEDTTAWAGNETTLTLTSNKLRDFGSVAVTTTVVVTLTAVTSPQLAHYAFKFKYGTSGAFTYTGVHSATGNQTLTVGKYYEATIVRGELIYKEVQ